MTPSTDRYLYPEFPQGTIAVVGGFGSGKSEVAVNLVRYLRLHKEVPVTIIDLDLVNPYFRSREAVKELERIDVRVVVPQGAHFWADLPIILPEVHAALEKTDGYLILDVGGDEQGSRALGSMVDAIDRGRYQQLMVLNSNRPFTSDVAGCVKTMERIVSSSRQSFTGLVANSHLVEQTSADDVLAGYSLAREVEKETGLPLLFVSAMKSVLDEMDISGLKCPVLPLTRSLLKPWETRQPSGDEK